jgi:ABC-type multidrug transport system ATPase subunit
MEEVVSVKNLSFHYGGNEAVSNVSFSIERGDYVALVGHNGSSGHS